MSTDPQFASVFSGNTATHTALGTCPLVTAAERTRQLRERAALILLLLGTIVALGMSWHIYMLRVRFEANKRSLTAVVAALDMAESAIVVVDADKELIVTANTAAEKLLNCGKDLTGLPFAQFLLDQTVVGKMDQICTTQVAACYVDCDLRNCNADPIPVRITAHPLIQDNEARVAMMIVPSARVVDRTAKSATKGN